MHAKSKMFGRTLALLTLAASSTHAQSAAPGWEEQAVIGAIQHNSVFDLDGDVLAVGQPGEGAPGQVRIYVRSGATWTLSSTLGEQDIPCFGHAVALSGGSLAVGAPCAASEGSIFVYENVLSPVAPQQLEVSIGGTPEFGSVVALSGDTLIGNTTGPGRVMVFARTASTWSFQQELVRMPALVDDFARTGIALDGDRAVIGAATRDESVSYQGAAFVFVRNGTTWTQEAKLLAAMPDTFSLFGSAIALSGTTLLIGAPTADIVAYESGSVEAFERSGSSWQTPTYLPAQGLEQSTRFGRAVDLGGGRAAVAGDNLSVQVFSGSGSAWSHEQTIPNSAAALGLGTRLALSGEILAVRDGEDPPNLRVFAYGPINGSGCTANDECASGDCVDGICCSSACDAPCDECLAANGATGDGVCTIVMPGSPGSPVCAPLACTGTADCAECTADTDCPADRYCSSAGQCLPRKGTNESCGADCKVAGCRECISNRCVDQQCELCENDGQCESTQFCSALGGCEPVKPQGAPCDEAAEADCEEEGCRVCGELACRDGVCCESACDQTCEACTEALTGAADGVCAPIAADQDPESECPADAAYPESCGADGLCDGDRACRAYAKEGTACGEASCSGDNLSSPLCNTVGECVTDLAACSPYSCGEDACNTDCASDDDCAFGHVCESGSCEVRGMIHCSADGAASVAADDTATPCAAYLCNSMTGACRNECAASVECATGYACNVSTRSCDLVEPGEVSSEDGGCSCRAAPSSPGTAWSKLLLAALALGAVRRSSRRRPTRPRVE